MADDLRRRPMATRAPIPGLNPDILVWARERAGQDVEQVARKLKKTPEDLRAWEAGLAGPTYPQLEKLAYEIYKRPIALFFFPEPPEEEDPEHSFRTLPDFELADLTPNTRFRIRDGFAKQIALRELTGGRNPAPRKIFRDLAASVSAEPATVAAKVRDYLGVGIAEQRDWPHVTAALHQWRDRLEAHGVFVFKASFEQREVSGFCLYDDEFPIIYVNNSSAKTRQIFTLFHELAHVLLRTNGITKRDDSYIGALRGEERAVEVFCNAFAGEFLVPERGLSEVLTSELPLDESVARAARSLKVSREVVLRRLLESGRISQEYYRAKAAEWTADYFDRRSRGDGGNYYRTQGSYLGKGFLSLAFQQLYRGIVSRAELADMLGVKANSIDGLEQQLLASTSG